MKRLLSIFTEHEHGRLILALSLAMAAHAALLWGVRFTVLPEPSEDPVLSFNISLLQQAGGEPDTALAPPQEPVSPPPAASPPPVAPKPTESPPVVAAPAPIRRSDKPQTPVKTPPRQSGPERKAPAPQQLRAADLMKQGLQMARLDSAPRPDASSSREKRINLNSMTTVERFYIGAWVRKVEQVGTLNFPEEARRRRLTGKLTLDVAVRANGTVESIRLVRSSGHRVLDDAAFSIVHLAAPYAPFPPELRSDYDVLHIERTWVFDQGNRLLGQ